MDIETIKKKIEALSAETVAGAVTPPTVATIFSNIADVLASTRSVLDVDVIRAEGNITLRFVVLNSESGAQETVEVILPQAEQTLAGLMSATDKANADTLKGWYDAVSGNAVLTTIYYDEATSGANTLCLKARSFNREGVSTAYSVMLPAATATTAGLMTAADRTKLDTTLPNQIAKLQKIDVDQQQEIRTNEQDIVLLGDDVKAIDTRTTAVETTVKAHTTRLDNMTEQVHTNETDIATNTSSISEHASKIATLQEVDDKQQQEIETLGTNITTNANAIARINETMGPYTDRASVTLTATETGKAINAAGTKVAKSGWAIAEFTAEKGNVYLFKPGTTDADVCVFAEKVTSVETRTIDYTYTYNADGTIATATATYEGKTHTYTYTWTDGTPTIKEGSTVVDALPLTYKTSVGSYSPLVRLNADAELPKDGYCRYMSHFKGNKSITIAVSYKVGVADLTMLVTRDGVLASISTQLGNLSQREDETRAALEEKTPTMWANLLAVKDTAVMVDGVRVELPAHKNVVIKDFQSFTLADNTPNPKCITRFDIHYNGVAKIKSFRTSLLYTPTDETTKSTYCIPFSTIDVSMFDTSEFSSYNESIFASNTSLISVDTSTWKMPNTRSINCLFEGCTNLVSVGDTGGWDLGHCNWFYATFLNCNNLEAVNTHGWNTAEVGNCQAMFANCKKLTSLDFSTWDMSGCSMFTSFVAGCPSLTDITFGEGFGKAKKEGLTLDLSSCGSSKSYVLTDNTYNSMLTMYDRATNGLPTFTIKFSTKHNIPDGFIAAMTARGYTITQG